MNRKFTIFFSIFLFCHCSGDQSQIPAQSQEQVNTKEWTFIFIIPNDNDLDTFSDQILSEIRQGITSDSLAATVLIDELNEMNEMNEMNKKGLKQIGFTSQGSKQKVLDNDASSDLDQIEGHLRWTHKTYRAHRYALFYLGHGGRLDHISLDIDPGDGVGPSWASTSQFADLIRQWQREIEDSRLELLFLHQCGRASIEELYSFRNTTDVLIASETVVGAPNTYYRPLLQRISQQPEIEPAEIARMIVDIDEHSATLTVFDGKRLADLPRASDELASAILSKSKGTLKRPREQLHTFFIENEVYYDVCSFIGELVRINGLDGQEHIASKLDWFHLELVKAQSRRKMFFPETSTAWCGVSTLVPQTRSEIGRYQWVELYKNSRWDELISHIEPRKVILGSPDIQCIGSDSSKIP